MSGACGAVLAAYSQCLSGETIPFDMDDMQQSWLRDAIGPYCKECSEQEDPIAAITHKAYDGVEQAILRIINTGFSSGKLVLLGGVQINMPAPYEDHLTPKFFKGMSEGKETVDLLSELKVSASPSAYRRLLRSIPTPLARSMHTSKSLLHTLPPHARSANGVPQGGRRCAGRRRPRCQARASRWLLCACAAPLRRAPLEAVRTPEQGRAGRTRRGACRVLDAARRAREGQLGARARGGGGESEGGAARRCAWAQAPQWRASGAAPLRSKQEQAASELFVARCARLSEGLALPVRGSYLSLYAHDVRCDTPWRCDNVRAAHIVLIVAQ